MSWLAALHATYEKGVLYDFPGVKLMPISHTLQNAHINIVIDGAGNFKRATVLEKTQVVLPATENSAGRSGQKPPPHPLADKIRYIAKDYRDFGGREVSFFKEYEAQLSKWCSSRFSHLKATAVYKYITKGDVVKDLVAEKVLFTNVHGALLGFWPDIFQELCPTPAIFKVLPPLEKKKRKNKEIAEVDQGNALVCWSVEIDGASDSNTWQDVSLQQSWIAFDSQTVGKESFCFVAGENKAIAVNHPAKLRHTGDKAKLISSNDDQGFTFRGRFTDKTGLQAVGVSFEVSQKAHNALRWLISRQGFRNGDQVFVTWAASCREIPEPLQSTYDLWNLDSFFQEEAVPETELTFDHSVDLGQSFAIKLKKYLAGYSANLQLNEQISVIGLDSSTPGRMGIIFYRQLLASEFLKRLEKWHNQFAWPQRYSIETSDPDKKKKSKKKTIWPISSPAPRAIAEAAYGDILKSNDSLKKSVIERIMPCIVDARPFPRDIMESAVRRTSNRNNCEQWEWERNLGVACALFKGFYQRHPQQKLRREYNMALEEDRTTRDYLYGRLLAIAERIEEMAMIVADEKPRQTVASRLMQRFADRPYSTWLTIEKGIVPYQDRLKSKLAPLSDAYKRLLDDVCDAFDVEEFKSPQQLSGEFLLGFHSQRKWLRDFKLEKGKWVQKEQRDKIETEYVE